MLLAPVAAASDDIARRDFSVVSDDGMRIHVREVARPGHRDGAPLLLVHGARIPGVASFDLPVANGSLAADLATRTGRPVYVMDARGYGGSERPPAMRKPPSASKPLARAFEVVRDIDAVIDAVRLDRRPVALFGWATGGLWVGMYASLHPEKVDHVIVLNALYGGSDRHDFLGAASSIADPGHGDRLNPEIGGYTLYGAASLTGAWDRAIPDADKSAWRDPAVADALVVATLASDPQAPRGDGPQFRAPMGAIEDSFYQAAGRRLFDASSITARLLVVRADHDFWSRREDADAFVHDAVRSADARRLDLPDAGHFVHLDRAEHGRMRLLDAVTAFLATPGHEDTVR